MTTTIPRIQQFMTNVPFTIGPERTLAHAQQVMREHDIRHLPVVRGAELVGLITDRDLQLAESLEAVDLAMVQVADAMSTEVYTVQPDAPLDQVVQEMATRKYGSAVVMAGGKVVGIFTTVDVCRACVELLRAAAR